jgi:ATP-binding cassette, subfamily B, bacterial
VLEARPHVLAPGSDGTGEMTAELSPVRVSGKDADGTVASPNGSAGQVFVPPPVPEEYAAPRGKVDPDSSKSWLRRALPIVLAHKGIFITSLVLSFAGLVLQVLIPQILGADAVDQALVPFVQQQSKPSSAQLPVSHYESLLMHYVLIVLALAVLAGIFGYVSRLFLMNTAYKIEFDLRNTIYMHLSRMSFGFYDRVQSGQLISRANSDIRSVQMYLTFGPSILVQCGVAVVGLVLMLLFNVPLALVSMCAMPLI